MKISQLIEELKNALEICGDVPVILANDEEGNGYFSLYNAHRCDYNDAVIFYPYDVCESVEECITNIGEE